MMINSKSLAFTFCIFSLCLSSIRGQNTVLTAQQVINFSGLTDEVEQYNRVTGWSFVFYTRKSSEYGTHVIYRKELIGDRYQQVFGYYEGKNSIATYTLWNYGRWLGLKQQVRNLNYVRLTKEEAKSKFSDNPGDDFFDKREFYLRGAKLIIFFEDKPSFQMQVNTL